MDGRFGLADCDSLPIGAGAFGIGRYVAHQPTARTHHVRHGSDPQPTGFSHRVQSSERCAKAFALPPDLALGVILVGCCPGGTASNVITYLAKGDLALSVGMTAVSTLLAPLMTPLLTWLMAGTFVDVDTIGMLQSILYVVIAPIVAGLIIQKLLPTFTQRVVAYLPAFSTLMIAVVVALIVAHSAPRLLTGGLLIILVVMLHNICGLGVGYGIGHLLGLQYPKRVAISIEVGMQNSGLASSLATLHFAAFPMATIPGAIFSVWHNISGALAARLYNRS